MAEQSISILVVDDEPAIREVFKHFLARRGHEVVTCGTATEALKSTEKVEFDVIILDVVLPDMSGLDMAQKLKDSGARSKLIILTGAPGQDDEVRSRRLHVFKYLSKPIRASALIDVVEEAGSVSAPPLAQVN